MAYNTAYLSGPYYFGGKGAPKFWVYDDTVVAATVIAAGYISDGFFRGMEPGDLVFYRQFASLSLKSTPVISLHYVTVTTSSENTTLSAAYGSSSGLTVPTTSAAVGPTAANDVNQGYMLDSLWTDTVLDEIWANVDTTSGAAIWYPLTDHFVLSYSGVSFVTPSIGMQIPVPAGGILTRADVALAAGAAGNTALGATASLVMSRNATAITNGVITVTNGATTGDFNVAPSALNVFAAGDILNVAVSTTQTVVRSGNFSAYFKRNAAP